MPPSQFDVFLSHNSKDKPAVESLAIALKQRGLRVWLDKWELRPGQIWQDALEQIITTCRSALICIADNGIGPWEEPEMQGLLRRFVEEKRHGNNIPVIPVLLPGAPPDVKLPFFLTAFTWEDLRGGCTAIELARLQWGITGVRPEDQQGAEGPNPDEEKLLPVPAAPNVLMPATLAQIAICFLHPERREKLVQLRRWCAEAKSASGAARVVECSSVADAVARAGQQPDATLLLFDGFEADGRQLDASAGCSLAPFHVIINDPEWSQPAPRGASASLFQPIHAVSSDASLCETLRKALLRLRIRRLATARVLTSPEDLEPYFRLRYRVWSELQYLAPEKRCPRIPWELDYTDRTSIALGIFAKNGGHLLALGRLVRDFGMEFPAQVQTIETMLRKVDAKTLQANFANPGGIRHPFDILGEMNAFTSYYRELVVNGIAKAEISRVIVAPEHQKSGLGEAVVDTLCSLGRAHAVQKLFLACATKHTHFYERCGFRAISGVVGEQFATYSVPCLAMQHDLVSVLEPLEAIPV